MKRERKVFGRQTVTAGGGKPVTMEMHDGTLTVRPFRARKVYVIPLARVALFVMSEGKQQ